MIRQFHDISENINPNSKFVRKCFEKIYSPVPCFYLLPDGVCSVIGAAISVYKVRNIEEALLALWKAHICYLEEWPYEIWDSKVVEQVAQGFYRESYSAWLECECVSPEDFVKGLSRDAKTTIRDQFEKERPMNPPSYYPDEESVSSVALESLDYLALENLQLIMDDKWYDIEGMFQYRNYWFYLGWSCSG